MKQQECSATSDLGRIAKICLGNLREIVGRLDLRRRKEIEFQSAWNSWVSYYEGDFARFDSLLETQVRKRGTEYEKFIPISISHHNLHRLMEVLFRDLTEGSLFASRSTERIDDLSEVSNRLVKLLEGTTAEKTQTKDEMLQQISTHRSIETT